MRHNHCDQCAVTFDNSTQFMAHICTVQPLILPLPAARIAELEAKVAYWEKHHTECHDKWRREFQLRDAPVYVKLDALQAEADKLAVILEEAMNAGLMGAGNIYFDAREALAAYAKFKAGGG